MGSKGKTDSFEKELFFSSLCPLEFYHEQFSEKKSEPQSEKEEIA